MDDYKNRLMKYGYINKWLSGWMDGGGQTDISIVRDVPDIFLIGIRNRWWIWTRISKDNGVIKMSCPSKAL